MIQQHSLCQLHAIFLRFAVEIPVSQINTIDQVNIEELLLMWRWTPTNVIFKIPNVTFEQIGNQKPTNIRRDKKCPIEKQQGRQTVVDIHCAPLPSPRPARWWTRAHRKCRQSFSTSGTIHRVIHALFVVLESLFKYRSEEKVWYKIVSKSYIIQCTRDVWITFTKFTQNTK